MGDKQIIIRDVYHVPALHLPLFSLRVHRRVPGCGYHSDNEGAVVFFPTFSLAVDDEVDNYVTCRSLGRSAKTFNYIQPRASAKSAAAGSAPRRSARLNPPPSKDGVASAPVPSQPVNPAEGSTFTPLPQPTPRRSLRLHLQQVQFAPPPSLDAGGAEPDPLEPISPLCSVTPVSVAPCDDPSTTLDSLDESTQLSDDGPEPTAPLRGRPKLQTARINHAALLAFCRMPPHLLRISAAAIPQTGPTPSRISRQTRSTISSETADFATTSTSVTSPRTRNSSRGANLARLSASSPISARANVVKHSLHPNIIWTRSI